MAEGRGDVADGTVGGSYPEIPGLQIVAEIGRGSFGRVFKAIEPENGRHVAVKLLQGAAVDDHALRQFERERRAAGALSVHPNIVTVHRSGLDDAGRPYMVMELAPGRSLADRIRERGRFAPSEVAEIGVKLAGAV
jgi:serine/threonine protein kinase